MVIESFKGAQEMLKCPECGNTEKGFSSWTSVQYLLNSEGDDIAELDRMPHDEDEDKEGTECQACGHVGDYSDFVVE